MDLKNNEYVDVVILVLLQKLLCIKFYVVECF